MELASMLVGEPFRDHAASVSPVLAAFLRSCNDHVDDDRPRSRVRRAVQFVPIPQTRAFGRPLMGRRPAWALSASIFLLAGCGGSSPERFDPGRWLTANTAGKTVTLTLRAEGGGTGLGGFNGYSRGQVLVEIPARWRVTVRCLNTSSTPQSCAIVDNSLSVGPAFPGAATPHPAAGVRAGGSAIFSFVASRPGAYRIACLVDDEEIGNGMWEGLQIGGTRQPVAILVRRSP